MSSDAPGVGSISDDERTLHKLGYAQVLFREMGGFSNFAISFTIISILAGCLTSYFIAFNDGGPVAVTWGWLIVGFFVVLVALGMGEVASAMPTAGAIYYWSSKLGSPAWGWFTGWFNLIGQIGVTAAISYGAAVFWTALMNLWFPSVGTDTHTVFITFSAIMAAQLLLNLNGVRLLAWLNSISAWWHMVGVVAVTFAVPDVQGTLNAGAFDVTYIWKTSLGVRWAEFLLFIVCCAQFYCGTASVTAASRMMFAFSRDGAVPGGRQLFRKVSRTTRVPVYAVIAIAVLSWALMLPTLANGAIGYLVGTSIAVIGLYIAYGVPIYLRWRTGDAFQVGAWTLGRHYRWINPIAVAWIVVIVILFLMPTVPTGIPWHSGFDWNVVNYAPITVGGVLVAVGIWWMVSARKWFKGPVVEGTEEELERIEAGLDAAGAPQPASPAAARATAGISARR